MNKGVANRAVTERSVSSLQTLYTVVTALALTVAIQAILSVDVATNTISFSTKAFPVFAALVLTLIPFHQGANRYLDETYVVKGKKGRPLSGLIDFFFFFIEAGIFYGMALTITTPMTFYTLLIILFGIDVIWLIFVRISARENFKKIKWWLMLNLLTLAVLIVLRILQLWSLEFATWIILGVTLLRSSLDYVLEWPFYWPAYVTVN